MTPAHVAIIGAGVAGLAAAGRLRQAGIAITLIEAGGRPGGRAWTARFRGDVFDHGAAWLHDAARNPLAALATPADGLVDDDGQERLTLDGHPADDSDTAACQAAWDAVDTLANTGPTAPDTTLQAALAPLAATPWAGLVALWEGPIIAAADAARLGTQDWRRNRLGGHNLVAPEGLGAYVLRKLGTETMLDTAATAVRWSGPGVRVETARGTLAADAAIVTVSTGVLAAGSIRFDPPLPALVRDAVAALPMGLLSKVALPAAGPDRLGLAPGTRLVDRDGRMTFIAWPRAGSHLLGFLGGDLAWDASRKPGAGTELARAELARTLGAGALRHIGPGALETGWGQDPLFRGAYAYAGPGDADRRGVLAAAFPAERLLFAGEATRMDGLAGTVAGAYLSGTEAAERLIAAPAGAPAGSP